MGYAMAPMLHYVSGMNKAIKVAALAVSAELLGSMPECDAAAKRAGTLLAATDGTLDTLHAAVRGMRDAHVTWSVLVDAYFDAYYTRTMSA